jgi:glutamate-1-semialdehyde 2,1-aminomutase
MNKLSKSRALFERAQAVIPGGVNSPVRACGSVGVEPVFFDRGDGCTLVDVDGNEYIDYVGSWGPLIVGHTHAELMEAISDAMSSGTTFGAPTELEVEFAEAVCAAVPSIEKVRAVSSGTEATMSALRLARGFTGRSKIVKIEGGYHGHADFLLVAAGSGAATLGIPGSAGVPAASVRDTLLVPFNDLGAFELAFREHGADIAAVIVEPVPGNMGCVAPADGYLSGLRELSRAHGSLLIFDEVMSGFRVAYGGAQERFGITPDLTCLGKIVGGGLPAAAFGGRAEIMDRLAPLGPVYQAGTLSGNPLAMAAGIKTLEMLRRPGTYTRLEELGARLERGLVAATADAGVPACVNRVGSMVTLFFTAGPVTDFATAKASDTERFGAFFREMLARGIYLPPSQFEAWFISLAHADADIGLTIEKTRESLRAIGGSRSPI